MSTRKHRDSQSVQPTNGEGVKPEAQGTAPTGQGKSPGKVMFFIWGIPLILFILIAVIKQCGG
jgi:hypothetical protein